MHQLLWPSMLRWEIFTHRPPKSPKEISTWFQGLLGRDQPPEHSRELHLLPGGCRFSVSGCLVWSWPWRWFLRASADLGFYDMNVGVGRVQLDRVDTLPCLIRQQHNWILGVFHLGISNTEHGFLFLRKAFIHLTNLYWGLTMCQALFKVLRIRQWMKQTKTKTSCRGVLPSSWETLVSGFFHEMSYLKDSSCGLFLFIDD